MTRLLSIDEAEGVLGLSVVTLRRLAAGGRVAFYRVGRKMRFSEADLSAYLETQRIPAGGVPSRI